MNSSPKLNRAMIVLVLLSLLVRGFLAAFLEFGNDEVYYWTYALYPDYSHFDHPPMVGFLIQLTSLNLALDSEFFIRLGSVLLGTLNIWLVYLIGKKVRDQLTGFYAALIYTGSIYAFIIAGTFILPDTPQLSFWLLTVYLLLRSLTGDVSRSARAYLLLAGITAGMALLSKYTSVFILFGVFLYILAYNRKWLKTWELYASAMIAFLFFLPVLIWNFNNDFISFTFQSDRVGIFESGLRADLFLTELGGQIFYNNPVNFILAVLAVIMFARGRKFIDRQHGALLVLISLPLILLFLFFSLYKQTLPHWTGPAWTSMIILSAAYLREIGKEKLLPAFTLSSLAVLSIVVILGIMQIKGGMLFYDGGDKAENRGQNDVSLDMHGWRQLSDEFSLILQEEENAGNINPQSPFIGSRWFPLANIDYYLASPEGIKVLGLGSLDALHKYAWMNKERGGFSLGMDAWFLTVSRDFQDPQKLYEKYFDEIVLAYTIPIHRNGKHVMNAFFYYLKDMKQLPE